MGSFFFFSAHTPERYSGFETAAFFTRLNFECLCESAGTLCVCVCVLARSQSPANNVSMVAGSACHVWREK